MITITISHNGKPTGEASLQKNPDGRYYLGKFSIYPESKGQGQGSKLIKKVNSFLDKEKASAFLINEIPSENKAHNIYLNNGWKIHEGNTEIMYYGEHLK